MLAQPDLNSQLVPCWDKQLNMGINIFLLISCIGVSHGYLPLQPHTKRIFPKAREEDVGVPLFLTDFIESGDIETGREMARVDSTLLVGIDEDIESYSGFFTVDKPNNGNMFFWFFPAEQDPETAPLKLHGPIITTVDKNNNMTGVEKNPYS